jgi:hypothetical protein
MAGFLTKLNAMRKARPLVPSMSLATGVAAFVTEITSGNIVDGIHNDNSEDVEFANIHYHRTCSWVIHMPSA